MAKHYLIFILICVIIVIIGIIFKRLISYGRKEVLEKIVLKNKELAEIEIAISRQNERFFKIKEEHRKQQLRHLFSLEQETNNAYQQYVDSLQQKKKEKEKEYERKKQELNCLYSSQEQKTKAQIAQMQSNLTELKKVYQAMTAARLRQQEQEEKVSFYTIKISNTQIADITHLQEWKKELHDPSVVSKIIWSTFIMKPTSDLCNRVLGPKPVCGIYKITNKITKEIYVGQSVNIADRWKNHIKCGLGIDASATNKLYNNMQQTGVWNFTFEVLQQCTRDKLNEKERFWIETYKSNEVGLNVTKGNK